MPPFPERESSLLSKLYQTAPWTAKLHQNESTESTTSTVTVPTQDEPQVGSLLNGPVTTQIAESAPVTDSLISTSPAGMCVCVCVCVWRRFPFFVLVAPPPSSTQDASESGLLIDVFGSTPVTQPSATPPSGFTPGAEEGYTRYMCTTAVSKLDNL